MIRGATVRFSNGNDVEADRVKFKPGGWIGVRATDGWAYYPPHAVERVVDRDRADDGREEPTRSEPADFGLGDSTGVQEL